MQKSDGTRHQYPKTEVIAIQEESTEEKMQEVIEDEAAIYGYEFTPDIRLVYQTFKVIYK